ncbi:MAG: copper chaperone PCu(A)C [Planctomycetes bacterium]|nr:copper chaperone PCu(A)C [Planctomycetota bacterium]
MSTLTPKLKYLMSSLLLMACSNDPAPSVDSSDSQAPHSDVLEIDDARARVSRPPHANSAAFMTIENHGDQDLVIVGVKTNRSKIGELHTMLNQDGKMKMRRVERLVVPSKSEIELKPGADHLMFFELDKAWRKGDEIELTLLFAEYPEQTVKLEVE